MERRCHVCGERISIHELDWTYDLQGYKCGMCNYYSLSAEDRSRYEDDELQAGIYKEEA